MTASPITTTQTQSLYDADYVAWIETTVDKLTQKDFRGVDWESLIDEIECMGRREKDSFESNLIVVMMHLLKWQYQPQKRTRSWAGSIIEHRRRLRKALKNSPSLKPYLEDIFVEAYDSAVDQAVVETGLLSTDFPSDCPYSIPQVLNKDFMPE